MLCIHWEFNKYQSISNIYQVLLYLKRLYRKVNLLKGIDSFQVVSWLYFWFGIYTVQLSSEVEKWLSFSCGVGVYKPEFSITYSVWVKAVFCQYASLHMDQLLKY